MTSNDEKIRHFPNLSAENVEKYDIFDIFEKKYDISDIFWKKYDVFRHVFTSEDLVHRHSNASYLRFASEIIV